MSPRRLPRGDDVGRAVRRGWVAPAGWSVLVAVAFGWGYLLRRSGRSTEDVLPPLHASARLLTWQMLPAVGVAVVAVAVLPMAARRLPWRRLLLVCWAAAAVWAVALAVSDGVTGLVDPLTSPGEYFAGLAPVLDDPSGWLRTFTERATRYPTHVAGHPPGPMMVLWALDAVGLHGPWWAAALLVGVGTSAVVAIAVTVRVLAGEEAARRVVPFLALAPLAVWVATTMDALFLGVGAWAVALSVSGGGRKRAIVCAGAGGVLFGALPYLSYGLLPLFAVGLVVLVATRPAWLVIVAVLAGCAVVPLVFTVLGFWWPDGVAATHAAYVITGGSARRPYLYFLVGDIAVLGLLVGPAVARGLGDLAMVVRRGVAERSSPSRTAARAALPAAAALVGVAVLDLSGLTRGEVERIWLPYAAWVFTAAVVHVPPSRRWLAVQAALGVVLQALVLSPW